MLSDAQIDRYSRQIVLPQIGGRGQQRLLRSRLVLMSGLSELEPALSYLVGAGVGTLDIRSTASVQDRRRIGVQMRDLNPEARLIWGEEGRRTGRKAQRAPDALLVLGAGEAAIGLEKAEFSTAAEREATDLERLFGRMNRQAARTALQLDSAARHHGGIGRPSGVIQRRIGGVERRSVTALRKNSALGKQSDGIAAHSVRAQYLRLAPAPTVAAHLAEPLELVVIPSRPPCLECIGARCLEPVGPRAGDWELVAMMAVTEALKLLLGIGPPCANVTRICGLSVQLARPKPRAGCRICAS